MAEHLHRRLSDEEIKEVLTHYVQRTLETDVACARLQIKRSRFFELLSTYRGNPNAFTISYARRGREQISATIKNAVIVELAKEKRLIADPSIPIDRYNYSAVRDAVRAQCGRAPSVNTIIAIAKKSGCWLGRPPKKIHDREVITDYPGELLQHDSSDHRWSPYAEERWRLITTIDDHSRLLLYADLFQRETSWTHISALKSVVVQYGIPLRYYVDSHSIFRYVRERDSMHQKLVKKTDEVDPQWKQVVTELGIDPLYALSAQAKGKVERPYRWLQDRIVRAAAKEHVKTIDGVRELLRREVDRYNHRQVHSTTKEIPILRFERCQREGRSVFRELHLPQPFTDLDDVFCLREERVVSAYRTIRLHGKLLTVPGVEPRQLVTIRMVPYQEKELLRLRIWHKGKLRRDVSVPITDMPAVQF